MIRVDPRLDDEDTDDDLCCKTEGEWWRRRARYVAQARCPPAEALDCASKLDESTLPVVPVLRAEVSSPPDEIATSPTISDYSTTAPRSPGENSGLEEDVEHAGCSSDGGDAYDAGSHADDPMVPPVWSSSPLDGEEASGWSLWADPGGCAAAAIDGKGAASPKAWCAAPRENEYSPFVNPHKSASYGGVRPSKLQQRELHHRYCPPHSYSRLVQPSSDHEDTSSRGALVAPRYCADQPSRQIFSNNISDSEDTEDLPLSELVNPDFGTSTTGRLARPDSRDPATTDSNSHSDEAIHQNRSCEPAEPLPSSSSWWTRMGEAFSGWRKQPPVTTAAPTTIDDTQEAAGRRNQDLSGHGSEEAAKIAWEDVSSCESLNHVGENLSSDSTSFGSRINAARHRRLCDTDIGSGSVSSSSCRAARVSGCRHRCHEFCRGLRPVELHQSRNDVAAGGCSEVPRSFYRNDRDSAGNPHCCAWSGFSLGDACGCATLAGGFVRPAAPHSALSDGYPVNSCSFRGSGSCGPPLGTHESGMEPPPAVRATEASLAAVPNARHRSSLSMSLVNISLWRNAVNVALLLIGLYVVVFFITSVRHDVLTRAHQAARTEAQKALDCQLQYERNRCDPDTRVPALDELCSQWELCLTNSANSFNTRYARFSAEVLGDTMNSFLEQFTWHSKASLLVGVAIALWSFR